MSWDISQFHFVRPLWLIALPGVLALWLLARHKLSHGQWESYLPKEMIAALQVNSTQISNRWQWWLLCSLFALILAAAGPSWIKQPVPVVKNQNALVITLDLSPSMLAEDITPNRLTLAKFKLIDILNERADGRAALIAFAGDAHTVSPLTDDPRTIEALLPALHPNVMPSRGSNVEAAVTLALQLLRDAHARSGEVLLISDGITDDAIKRVGKLMDGSPSSLSILGVGGTDAVPIPDQNGGFLRKSNGEIVLAGVNRKELKTLANQSGGRFVSLRSDDSDIDYLLLDEFDNTESVNSESGNHTFDSWVDMGHWLVLFALPFALFCFRKGFVYFFPLTVIPLLFVLPIDSQAAESDTSIWTNLWQTPDQQAAKLLEQEHYTDAAQRFQRKDWSAVANYRDGNYAGAINKLESTNGVTDLYNKGNALAFNGDLEQAIEAYDQVLQQQPDHVDAAHNKQVLEQLMQQNQQEQQQSNPSDSSQSEDQQSGNDDAEQQSQSEQNSDTADQQEKSQTDSQQQADSTETDEQSGQDQQQTAEQQRQQQEQEQEQSQPQNSAKSQADADPESDPTEQTAEAVAQETTKPLKDSSEQWLRSIQDDPSGLLRRKFEYQAWQRAQQQKNSGQSDKKSADDRY